MSSTLEQPDTLVETSPHFGPSPASVLIDRLPESWKWPKVVAGFACLLGLHFLTMSHRSLHHAEVWEQLSYGRQIVEHRALPQTDPFLFLQQGMTVTDNNWLGQVSAYLMHRTWGVSALQFLQAVCVTGSLLALTLFGYRRTRSVAWTVAGLGLFYLLDWFQFGILRPQLAGLFLFVLLVTGSTPRKLTTKDWLLVPLLFAVWANVHASFLAGLAWMVCLTLGRAIDLWRRSGQFTAFFHDRSFRRLVMLTELAAIATLVNPYGIGIYGHLQNYFQNSNLRDLVEWDPLQIRSIPGAVTALTVLALMVVYRRSPRKVSSAEVLAHLVFGGAALWNSGLLPWWSVVAVVTLVIHGAAATRDASVDLRAASPRAGKWTVIALAMAWIAFGFSPFGSRLLHGRQADSKKSLSPLAPADLAVYLREHPISGQVFNTMEVGDYLLWAGPRDLKLFMTSRVELAPREVWKTYFATINGSTEWKDHLDRYGVNAIILDKLDRKSLINEIKEDGNWKRDYEDNVAVVYLRKKPL
jgi:hypothetical protein